MCPPILYLLTIAKLTWQVTRLVNIYKNELRSKFASQINFMQWQVALILYILPTLCYIKGCFANIYIIPWL